MKFKSVGLTRKPNAFETDDSRRIMCSMAHDAILVAMAQWLWKPVSF